MQFFMDMSTSDGVGSNVSIMTSPVPGQSQEVLDDVLASMQQARPALDGIVTYVGNEAESGKWTPEQHIEITAHVQALANAAVVDQAARDQLDAFVEQCMTDNLIDPFKTQYVGYIVDTAVLAMSTISNAINAGAHQVDAGKTPYTEGITVEFVSQDE